MKMNLLKLTVLVTGLCCPANHSSASEVTVTAGRVSGEPGSTIELPVSVSGGPAVEAARVVLTYDSTLLEADSVNAGKAAIAGNAMAGFTVNEPGRLTMNFVSTEGVAGEGEWFRVKFKVSGESGQSTPVSIEKVVAFRFDNRVDILADTVNGTLDIRHSLPWKYTAVILSSLLVAALVTLKRTRKGHKSRQASEHSPLLCALCGSKNGPEFRICSGCGQPREVRSGQTQAPQSLCSEPQ